MGPPRAAVFLRLHHCWRATWRQNSDVRPPLDPFFSLSLRLITFGFLAELSREAHHSFRCASKEQDICNLLRTQLPTLRNRERETLPVSPASREIFSGRLTPCAVATGSRTTTSDRVVYIITRRFLLNNSSVCYH